MKKNKGITLVALVITIIVLIILAGVSINAVMNGGLITNAKDAKNKYEEEKEEEQKVLSQLEIDEVQMDFLSKGVPYSFKSKFLTGVSIVNGKAETVGEFRKKLPEEYGYEICDSEGGKITDENTIVCPGMVIKKDGEEIGKVVIFGDIVGSIGGEITLDDSTKISQFLNSANLELDDYRIVAMDVNHDNVINYEDRDLIYKASFDSYKINQNIEVQSLTSITIENVEKAKQKWMNSMNSKIKSSKYSVEEDAGEYYFKGVVAGTKVGDLIESDEKTGYLPKNTVIERDGELLDLEQEVQLNDEIYIIWGSDTDTEFWGYIDF